MSDVFDAVSDPTRRDILDRLRREGPLSIQELSRPLPMSRQAVSKHLGVLASAGLVNRERRGRERLHRLDPRPLQDMEAWLSEYSAIWDQRLERLRAHLSESEAS